MKSIKRTQLGKEQREMSKSKLRSKLVALALALMLMVMTAPFMPGKAEAISSTAGTDGFIVPVNQQTTVPDGYTGIYTAADLDAVRNNLSGNYILMNDIDLSEWGNWTPIGNYDNHFSGVFDGNGYVISNMSVDIEIESRSGNVAAGLFGYIDKGEIKNLGIVLGDVEVATFDDDAYVGGVAGVSTGSISNCYNTCTISASSSSFYAVAGGIAGSIHPLGSINDCYNTGDISVASGKFAYAGGIVGWTEGSIGNCYNTGDISSFFYDSYTGVGGIVGRLQEGSIYNCYCLDNISTAVGYEFSAILNNVSSLTSAQMQQQSSYTGFDFDTVWTMGDSSYPYPVLRMLTIEGSGSAMLYGDITGDSAIDVNDVVLVMRSIVGTFSFNAEQMLAADVNGDETVDVNDVVLIMKRIVGTQGAFPAEA